MTKAGDTHGLGLEVRASEVATDNPRIVAVLAPNNYGKTHLALEEHARPSQRMIGFPCASRTRNYGRYRSLKGRGSVALINGEERILPRQEAMVRCNVRSMPLDREAGVRLSRNPVCEDRERGHVCPTLDACARAMPRPLVLGAEKPSGC